jgi:hypothetical protein
MKRTRKTKIVQVCFFRMSTQGQGDGGVYVSTQGPASYDLGSDEYEDNIIKDCFGVERIDEYRGKGKLDVIIVYGCAPDILQQVLRTTVFKQFLHISLSFPPSTCVALGPFVGISFLDIFFLCAYKVLLCVRAFMFLPYICI